ncbi:hypothetical protein D9M70_542580 [compost metagenome]
MLAPGQRRTQPVDEVEIKTGQVTRLIAEHLRLVLQLLHLVVDLLQRANRRQRVLHEVRGVEHDVTDTEQGVRRLHSGQGENTGDGKRGQLGFERRLELHDGLSCGWEVRKDAADGSNSAAQSRPR